MQVVAAELARRIAVASGSSGFAVEASILGTSNPDLIAAELIGAVERSCGASVLDVIFYRCGSGAVVGLTLADGTAVVAKAHQPHVSPEKTHLRRLMQRRAADAGLPVPGTRAGPILLGRGHLTVDAHLAPGVACADLSTEDATPFRRLIAEAMSTIARLGTDLTGEPTLAANALEPGSLYPRPHSPIFDFAATGAGAEWIDELAADALRTIEKLEPSPVIVTHTDLRAENVRIDPGGQRLAVIWDWDGIGSAPEMWHVGNTARAYSLDLSRNGGSGTDIGLPSVPDMLGFVDDYEQVRGRALTVDERRAAHAHIQHCLAYSARCEHALNVSVGPVRWDPGFADRLREFTAASSNHRP